MSAINMNLGQYVPTGSIIHRLDPRAKLISMLLIISAIFPSKTYWGIIIWCGVLWGLVCASKISWRSVLRSAKPVFFLAVFTLIFHIIAGLFRDESLTVSVISGVFMSIRLVILMMFAVMLPLTTSPLELADGLDAMLRPLSRFKFPVNEVSMMIAMALRFIPLLMEETDRIIRAQVSRGARIGQGNIFQRVKSFMPILIPLIVIIFRRADEIAVAMEARGYDGGTSRTRRKPLIWRWRDTFTVMISAVCVGMFFEIGL